MSNYQYYPGISDVLACKLFPLFYMSILVPFNVALQGASNSSSTDHNVQPF